MGRLKSDQNWEKLNVLKNEVNVYHIRSQTTAIMEEEGFKLSITLLSEVHYAKEGPEISILLITFVNSIKKVTRST